LSNHDQDLISGRVAVAVIHQLEVVKIEEENGE
jgi:hypothetical protein